MSAAVMGLQEVFDTVATHLFTQGRPSLRAPGVAEQQSSRCRYRSHDGLSCAVGCLIPDHLYSPEFEGQSIDMIVLGLSDLEAVWPFDNVFRSEDMVELMGDLQAVHDIQSNWVCSDTMYSALERVRRTYKLSDVTLNTLKFADR